MRAEDLSIVFMIHKSSFPPLQVQSVLRSGLASQRHFAEAQGEAGAVLSGNGGAAAAAELHRSPRGAAHPEQEVEVCRRVHGVKHVGVVRNHQLFLVRNNLHQLISLLWLHFQVVLCHSSSDHCWRLVLIGQQDALVEVSVAVLQADSDDAGVLGLCVVEQGLSGGAGGERGEGDGAAMGAGVSRVRGGHVHHGNTGGR